MEDIDGEDYDGAVMEEYELEGDPIDLSTPSERPRI